MSTIAEDLIASARSYTEETVNNAIGAMNGAAAAMHSIATGPPAVAPSLQIHAPTPSSVGTPPPYAGNRFQVVAFDGVRPDTQSIPTLDLPPEPGAAPILLPYTDPPVPTGEPNSELLNSPPSVNTTLAVPSAQDLLSEANLIPKPVLLDITVRPAPRFSAPEFLGVRPDLPPAPPKDLDQKMRTEFSAISPVMREAVSNELDRFMAAKFPGYAAGMAAIEARIATYMAGGSALSPEIEQAIYNRTLDRTNKDAQRANRQAWTAAARAGHLIPSAILLSQLQDVDQARRDNNARAAIDIATKQAELEQQNLQFAVTTSTQLRQIAVSASLSYYNGLVSLNGQALEYARDVVDAVVKSYEIAAKYAEIMARLYEAEAQVFEAKIRGALAEIEAYAAEIKGLEAQSNVNLAKVTAYKARIEALQAEATVYRAVVDGVVASVGLERARVDVYTARVQGYGAQVSAYTARYQGYEAAVRGQAAKMQASAEQVKAYAVQVSAYEAVVRAKAVEVDAYARAKEAAIRSYAVDVSAYEALVRAQSEAVRAEIESFSASIQAYIAKSTADAKHSEAEIASYEAGQRSLIAAAQLHLATLTEANKVLLSKAEGLARVATSAGEIWSAQAQASLSGMNSLAAEITNAVA